MHIPDLVNIRESSLLTTTLMCLDRSLALPIRKSENAVWKKAGTSLRVRTYTGIAYVQTGTHSPLRRTSYSEDGC